MSHNIHQIKDGIDDQIAGVNTKIQDAQDEITRLQALIPNLQADLVVLNEMKDNLSNLSDSNLTINVNVNGSSAGQMSVPVNHGVNI